MAIGDIIQRARVKKGWSKSELARRLKVSRTTITQWETGETAPNRSRLPKVVKLLGLEDVSTVDPFSTSNISGVERNGAPRYIPLIGWPLINTFLNEKVSVTQRKKFDRVEVDDDLNVKCFALRITDESMAPKYNPGDKIIIDPDRLPIDGDDGLVFIGETKQYLFRNIRYRGVDKSDAKVFDLVSENPNYETITINSSQTGEIVGSLVEVRQKRNR